MILIVSYTTNKGNGKIAVSYAGIVPIRYEGIISASAFRPQHPLACTLQTGHKNTE